MSTKAAERSRETRRVRSQEVLVDARRRRRKRTALWVVTALALAGLVTAMLMSSRPDSSTAVRAAPDFTLTGTDGASVTLSDLRGDNVLLFFSEGAGCQSCLVQMDELEKNRAALDRLDITVLPIVMNTRDQILSDMAANDVTTPFLLDDGSVAQAYDTLGKGMHPGLPGHAFVLVDKGGSQRWYGEYPSMWVETEKLIAELKDQL